ncbi:MAG: hypothetical protein ACLGI5_01515 [Thermoleophilia bacterium]
MSPADGCATREGLTSADGRRRRADTAPAGVPPTRACAVTPPRTPACVALLAPAGEAPALASALALALARRDGARTAVVCLWAPAPVRPLWREPALPAAARLAAALAGRGHRARASGRLALVRLEARCEQAAAEALRVAAAAGSAPTVLALAGPRAAAFDAVLSAQDLVVVAVAPRSDPALARLALAGLERAVACEVPPPHVGRWLAAAGVALPPSARRALAAPVEALT